MSELFSSLSDNQFALLGCVGAVLGGLMMLSVSYRVGQPRQSTRPVAAKLHAQPLTHEHQDRRAA